ncbi:MAG: GNAT family N-acetyltransferase [Burkholderiales bacterium]|nr:GNAT family N-acetyltransferase [Burkholderiales bacterium]
MDNFKFINFNNLNDNQLTKLAELLFETGYYEYISLNNKLNLLPVSFQKIQTLEPFSSYTHVLIDSANEVVGFFIAGTHKQIREVEQITPNWYRDGNDIQSLLEPLSHFYINETADTDFILYGIAISSVWRGKGIFKILYNEQVKIAKNYDCSNIIFTVWNSNQALSIYKHYGAKIIGELDLTDLWCHDKLIKCCFNL